MNQCQLTLVALLLRNTVNESLYEALEGQAMLHAFQRHHDYMDLIGNLAENINKLITTIPGYEP